MKHLMDKLSLDKDLFTLPKRGKNPNPPVYPTLRQIRKTAVLERYVAMGRSKTDTAKSLGVTRTTLYRMLDEWGVL